MLFHTWPFFIFALVVLPVFYLLRRTRFWMIWLLIASYFFYGWWKPIYLLLVIYSTALDYLLVTLMDHCPPLGGAADESAGAKLDSVLRRALAIFAALTAGLIATALLGPEGLRPAFFMIAAISLLMTVGSFIASRRAWLFISIVNNLALLLFFKYARFVEQSLSQLFAWLGWNIQLLDPAGLMPRAGDWHWDYALPVGISFFTFQSMSYTIDFCLGKVTRERNILRFATFVCFFPQLMAGPIERARQILPQFQQAPAFKLQNITDGLSLFLVGLFKKLALANYLAMYADRVYENDPAAFSATQLTLATFAFAWQIFFDFSGYTDMARGLAKMMGFDLILNFHNPYMAAGLGEFWTRWHISLSSWFRDYVYIPLGGSRGSSFALYRNLFITFVVSGIWHGANWTFLIWGVLHAVGVMATRDLERSAFYRQKIPLAIKRLFVFLYVSFAWIFFRAASLSDATTIVRRIFSGGWDIPQVPALLLLLVGAVVVYQSMYESKLRGLLRFGVVRVSLAVAMILYMSLCSTRSESFIYFQF